MRVLPGLMLSSLMLLGMLGSPARAGLAWEKVPLFERTSYGYTGGYPLIDSADLDQDGDLDIIAFDANDLSTSWYRNEDGQGREWTGFFLNSGYSPFALGDFDGDGDTDIITLQYSVGILYFYPNVGGEFPDLIPIGSEYDHVFAMTKGDVNSDGAPDIIISFESGESVSWLENLGGLQWEEHLVTDSYYEGKNLGCADLNGDLQPDIFITSDFGMTITWWSNDSGDGSTWTEHTISITYPGAWAIEAADIDQDQDLDLVTTSNLANRIAWWENWDGTGLVWMEHVIVDDPSISLPQGVSVADWDGDEDLDFVVAVMGNNEHVLYENTGGYGQQWVGRPIEGMCVGAMAVDSGDVDGDGSLDLLVSPHDDGIISWYRTPSEIGVTATPTSLTQFHAGGGMLTCDLRVFNATGEAYPFCQFWVEILLPDGTVHGPTFAQTFSLHDGMDFTYSGFSQPVPAFAPEGEYLFQAYLGQADVRWLVDSFPFSKMPASPSEPEVDSGWTAANAGFAGSSAGDETGSPRPVADLLHPCYPNPFNPVTTVAVSLTETSDLTVTVVDLTGRTVKEIARGSYGPGRHEMSFDGTGLASGVYFIHAQAPGTLDQVQRVMLMK